MSLPPEAAHLLGFARLLRAHGFRVAPEQVTTFMRGVTLLGPRSMEDIRQAGLATLAPPSERRGEYEALFRVHFHGEEAVRAEGEDSEERQVKDDGGATAERGVRPTPETGGEMASAAERLAVRRFDAGTAPSRFGAALAAALPRRHSFRTVRTVSRGRPDLRRSLREIARFDGDVPEPLLRRRQEVARRVVMLIDVSGSMKLHTEDYLTLAHAVVQAVRGTEVFVFGTRLTRITRALRSRDRGEALARAGALVVDWDGGTRIGPALMSFLAVPRFAAMTRGALVLILSDALERGDPAEMEAAVRRIGGRAYRLSLATPLAGDPRFRPETAALKAILPALDDLVDGSSIGALGTFMLSLGRPAVAAGTLWQRR